MLKVISWKWKGNTTKNKPPYIAKHVNTHFNMCKRNIKIPFEYVCITDDPTGLDSDIKYIKLWDDLRSMPGCYLRLKALSDEMSDILGPKFISFDLDCVIVDDITDIVSKDSNFCIWCTETRRRTPYCGSLWMHKPGTMPHLWNNFDPVESPKRAIEKGFTTGTDQAYFSYMLYPNADTWTKKDGIYNFKIHIENRRNLAVAPKTVTPEMRKLPNNAKIIFFNGGKVDPSLEWLQERYPWIREHWR